MPKPVPAQSTAPGATPALDAHLYSDAVAFGARKALRDCLQEHDTFVLVQAKRRNNCYTTALLGSLVALNFAPELTRASKHCLSTITAEASAGCRANAAPALGALFGLGLATAAGWALYQDINAVGEHAAHKDVELQQRFAQALPSDVDEERVSHLMSRYNMLPTSQRRRFQQDLFDAKQ